MEYITTAITTNAQLDGLIDEYQNIYDEFSNLKLKVATSREKGDELIFLNATSGLQMAEKQTSQNILVDSNDHWRKFDEDKLQSEVDSLIVNIERILFDIGWMQENEEEIYDRIQLVQSDFDCNKFLKIELKRNETKANMRKVEEDVDKLRREIQLISYQASSQSEKIKDISPDTKRPSIVKMISWKLQSISGRGLCVE
mmetsp:Transcript_61754/g.72162  ORF Transcript_61754/g.72162 Transcript_61754/m.72162 type:complete len:199 (-) Transcript_61754:4-600(-)